MIIAGACSYISRDDEDNILKTAQELKGFAHLFRCKVWCGGTRVDRWYDGIGSKGLYLLQKINDEIIPAGTECQLPSHFIAANKFNLSFAWIGARNCQNYGLIRELKVAWPEDKMCFVKRGFGITIEETINLYDIYKKYNNKVYIIERGVNTFDRGDIVRWRPDLLGVVMIKQLRPDIFENLVIDCAHSVGDKKYIHDIYTAFRAVGVRHFMFEVLSEPEKSLTDKRQILSISEFKDIVISDNNQIKNY